MTNESSRRGLRPSMNRANAYVTVMVEGHTPLWRGKVSVYHAKGVVAAVISQKSVLS